MNFKPQPNQITAMKQEVFEELIKDYVEKVVDKENPAIVNYKVTLRLRRTPVKVQPAEKLYHAATNNYPNAGKKVQTPNGVYNSIKEAANKYDITYEAARQRCLKQKEGWKFYDSEI
jgi:hypothetical protein